MTNKAILIALLVAGVNIALAAETAKEPNKAVTKESSQAAAVQVPPSESAEEVAAEPVLPAKGSTEYWIIRSEAMTDFVPLLTQKRSEVKKKRQLLADYILKIGKAEVFAELQMPAAYDAKIYADILQVGQGMNQMNMDMPKERPSWDQLVEIAMKFVVYEGYVPTAVEEGEDAAMYIDICKKKEEYGQKVRKDMRTMLDQAANMWRYLDSIGQLSDFKAFAAEMYMQKKADKAAEKAMYSEQHREEVIARAASKEQRKFDDAEERASFRSERRERVYDTNQDLLQYRQSRLDERFVNSSAYYD